MSLSQQEESILECSNLGIRREPASTSVLEKKKGKTRRLQLAQLEERDRTYHREQKSTCWSRFWRTVEGTEKPPHMKSQPELPPPLEEQTQQRISHPYRKDRTIPPILWNRDSLVRDSCCPSWVREGGAGDVVRELVEILVESPALRRESRSGGRGRLMVGVGVVLRSSGPW